MNLFDKDYCLICGAELEPDISWTGLFLKVPKEFCCEVCRGKLILINGEVCKICGRPLGDLQLKYIKDNLCYDCERWETDPEWHSLISKNHSLYTYNEFLKEVIARFKFRGDYILAKAFGETVHAKLASLSYDLVVPIPLSKERQYERGFNQAEALILEAGFTPTPLLKRLHSEKQSKKSRAERIHSSSIFGINPETTAITEKNILLFDDIYTTGATLRYAAKVLKNAGVKTIQSVTLAR